MADLTIKDLGDKVKAKYPGTYDDMDSLDLGAKIKLKYPHEYADFKETTPSEISNGDLLKQGVKNLPKSAVKLLQSLQMGSGDQQPASSSSPETDKANGYTSGSSLTNLALNTKKSLSDSLSSILKTFTHPLQSFSEDPAGTLQTLSTIGQGGVSGLRNLAEGPAGAMTKGALKGGYESAISPEFVDQKGGGYVKEALRNLPGAPTILGAAGGHYAGRALGALFGEPEAGAQIGTTVGTMAPAVKGAIRGGKAALQEYKANQLLTSPKQQMINRLLEMWDNGAKP